MKCDRTTSSTAARRRSSGDRLVGDELRAEVRGQDQDGVPEVDRPALAVGEPAVVEHLQQDVEDVGVRLLHLVEQHHGVRTPPHRLGELPAGLVADVAGRRADQPGHRVLLGVLAHVDADHRPLVVEQELRQRLGQLGLADAGRAEEEEGTGRAVGVGDAGPGPADGVGDGADRLGLADDPPAELVLHPQQLLRLALEQPAGRDAGPGLHDLGDVVGADLLLEHRVAGADRGLGVGQRPLQLRQPAVAELGDVGQVAVPLGPLGLQPHALQLLLDPLDPADGVLVLLPPGGQLVELLAAVGQVLAQGGEPRQGRRVVLLRQRHLLDLHAPHGPLDLVDLDRPAVDLHAQPAGGLVDQVDGLVRQEAGGHVAVRQRRGGDHRGVGDPDAVVHLVALLEPAQDADRVLDRGLADEHLLEAALQRGVLLDVLAVLVEGGGPDHAQLAAGEHGLDHVAGVHGGLPGGAGADDRVQLVDEGDDLPLGVGDLLQHGLEPLLELAAVLGAGDHRAQVERHQPLALEALGDVAGDDALGEPLDDRRLADAGLADQHRVVLGAAGQHLDDAADLGVPADDRVDLALAGPLR